MSGYTEGPWEVDEDFDVTTDGGAVVSWTAQGAFEPEEMIANARLIAAAPELLKALQELFADYKQLADSGDAGNWSLEDTDAGKKAMAAIVKALGQ